MRLQHLQGIANARRLYGDSIAYIPYHGPTRDGMERQILSNFRSFGTHPLCRRCRLSCKQPNVPHLQLQCQIRVKK